MSESDTPRTDAAEFHCDLCNGEDWPSVKADFARQLERELNEAKHNKHWLGDLEEIQALRAERDAWKADAEALAIDLNKSRKNWRLRFAITTEEMDTLPTPYDSSLAAHAALKGQA